MFSEYLSPSGVFLLFDTVSVSFLSLKIYNQYRHREQRKTNSLS